MTTFTKVHGLGNDFICLTELLEERSSGGEDSRPSWFTWSALRTSASDRAETMARVAQVLCHRRFGVGADGVVLLLPSSLPDHHFRFEIYNADGSAAAMCGNAIRCAAKLVWERRKQMQLPELEDVEKPVLVVDTPAGTVRAYLIVDDKEHVSAVRVNMGKPSFARKLIPCVPTDNDERESGERPVLMKEYESSAYGIHRFSSALVGVPHTVIFVNQIDDELVRSLGPVMEKDHQVFPQGTNVSFVQVMADNHLNYRVWERGAGPTLACGTGASAAAVLAAVLGHADPTTPIFAHLAGGDLTLHVDIGSAASWRELTPEERVELVETVWMEGPAEIVYEGHFDGSLFDSHQPRLSSA